MKVTNRGQIAAIRARHEAQNRLRCEFVSRQTDSHTCNRCGLSFDHPRHLPEDITIPTLCDALELAWALEDRWPAERET